MNKENVQTAMNNLTAFLKTIDGLENLDRIDVVDYGNDIYARPIFKDGTGATIAFKRNGQMHGYYDIDISCDSPFGAIDDVWEHFVKKIM